MSTVLVKHYNNAAEASDTHRWWDVEPANRSNQMIQVINRIYEYQKYREIFNIRYARLYHNMDLSSLRAGMFARTSANDARMSNRVTLNVIKSCTDTVASKIAKNKPRPMFLTSNGNWGLQRKAKLLTKYLEGLFDHQGAYTEGARGFVDSCVFGTGVMKMYVDRTNQIAFERVIPDEILVDETEGRYEKPQQLFHVKLMTRDVLVAMFPKFKDKIVAVPSGLTSQEKSSCTTDMIRVAEGWHLQSDPTIEEGPTDGRHTIAIDNCTLLDEPYYKDYFPFVFMRWTPRILGFYGMGLAEELIGIQLEINKILRNIQIAQHLCAVPQVWLEANSHVVKAHVNNEIGGVKNYVGTKPEFFTPTAMNPEIYQHLERLYAKAFEITGVSQLSASSVKPAGVTAAVAMREMTDIETERFMLTAQRYEQMYMDAAKIAIDMTRDLYKKNPGVSVKVKDGKFMKQIKWKDVDLDDDMYSMRIFPTSLLPSQPAGKLQKVQELMQAGFLDKDESLSLLDFPDTDKAVGLKTAARENILRIIDLMLDEGHPTSVEPYMNVQLALQLAQNAYNEAETQNAPEDRLELLINFMNECAEKISAAAAPQIAMGQTPDMAAQAVPQGPPTSDLLPFAGSGQPPGGVPQVA